MTLRPPAAPAPRVAKSYEDEKKALLELSEHFLRGDKQLTTRFPLESPRKAMLKGPAGTVSGKDAGNLTLTHSNGSRRPFV